MSKIGIGGLACSIVGLVLALMASMLPFMLFALGFLGGSEILLIIMYVVEFSGLGLGGLGLILSIVGTVKDEKKAPGIVGIVLGSIALFIGLMSLVLVPAI